MISEIIQSNQDRFLLVTGDQTLCPSYMLKMLDKCGCSCILPLRYSKDDEYLYDTLHGISLSSYIQKKGYTPQLLKNLLYSLQAMLKITSAYLLDPSYIVLDAQYIYVYDHESFRYIFNPYSNNDLNMQMRQLIKSLTENNYVDKCVMDACDEPQFDLKAVISAIESNDISLSTGVIQPEESVTLRNLLDADDCITIKDKDIKVGKAYLINDKRLPGQLASFRHACIRYSRKIVYIKDFKTKNGTYINGERIKPSSFSKAQRGDIVSFGDDEYIIM